ncbi:AmmeMemoRadiSam system radical SAM enzyme [uncultured Desulfobacter sp.]|uniref:AmmeMemoRadiSam system radical SAM enzyme n=1 Tax=uncultured Desulfobacter sp. TaxID=240139 RepID=UPI0029F5BDD6|nr:AmmeMemoRadiSam system radical SAM enzyme [uncultured Desulfobacter sp.]
METITRREFIIKGAMALPVCLCCPQGLGEAFARTGIFKGDAPKTLWKWSRQAMFFKRLANKKVMCLTCPNACVLSPGDRSLCRSKVNMDGTLYSIAYGNPCVVNIDPVEKKPLYHFKPGSRVFSIAAAGCNFRCLNCQNWEISQARPEDVRHYDMFPDAVIEKTLASTAGAIAYTYSEAITYYEYMADTAAAAKKKNIANFLISNGYIRQEPLKHLCGLIDAANINLKSFSDKIYKDLNGGRLSPVLETFKTLNREKVHFEITNLVIPGYTDDETMFRQMCKWILNELGDTHPLHLLRFVPQYRLDRLEPTPVHTLERFRDIARDIGLNYTYIGNVPGHKANHTYCHSCGRLLVRRMGYRILERNLLNGACRFCTTPIPGVWKDV